MNYDGVSKFINGISRLGYSKLYYCNLRDTGLNQIFSEVHNF